MASPYDPFDSAIVLGIQDPISCEETRWQGFHFVKGLENSVFSLPDVGQKNLEDFHLGAFTLDLEEVPVPSFEASTASSLTTAEDDLSRDVKQLDNDAKQETWEDVWTFPEVKNSSQQLKLTSWDHFSNGQHYEPATSYLSEAGAATFDAIVSSSNTSTQIAPLVVPDRFLHALYELGLGNSSLLFRWSKEEHRFVQGIDNFAVSGCTPGLVQDIADSTAAAGALMKKLSECERFYRRDSRADSPALTAFHSALRSCLMAIEQYMDGRRQHIFTVLHLQQAHLNAVSLIGLLERVAILVKASDSDQALLASLVERATGISFQYPQFDAVLNLLLSAVASPILEELACDIGLNTQHCTAHEGTHTDGTDRWTAVLPTDLLQMVQQCAQTLKLLQEDPFGIRGTFVPRISSPGFSLRSGWASIINIQTAADDYERTAKSALLPPEPGEIQEPRMALLTTGSTPSLATSIDIANPFELFDIERQRPRLADPDPAFSLVLKCLDQSQSEVELALSYDEVMAQSISPLLFAQHRLLSYAIFELLFTRHKFVSQLTLQHHVQLLGDGMLAARLSTALFDSERSSGESKRRTGANTGLRLQTRDTWPPASSELRLVLMGVLSESMYSSDAKALEGNVSFAIRDLSNEELERCRDVDSIHALDFLKLQYRPLIPVLEAVISSESLEKYDRIFQHLLRILRLKSVAQGLLRDVSSRRASVSRRPDHSFRVEIQCFISAVADYCQNIAVNRSWASFEQVILDVEKKVGAKDYDGVMSLGQTLESLKRKHEDTLDSILRALLLKRKQKQALQVLEDIFGGILRYAAAIREPKTDKENLKRYHEEFRMLVQRFIVVLQDMSTSEGRKSSHGDGEELFEELLLRVDFSGYWSR